MLDLALAAGFAVFAWWFSTGLVLLLDGLPKRSFRWSLLVSSLIALAALVGIAETSVRADAIGAYVGLRLRAAGLGLGRTELPDRLDHRPAQDRRAGRGPRLAALRDGGAGHPVARTRDPRRRRHRAGAHLAGRQPGRRLDLRRAVGAAHQRQAEPVLRRAQPQRGVPAAAPGLPAELLPPPCDERLLPAVDGAGLLGPGRDDDGGAGCRCGDAAVADAGRHDAGAGHPGAPAAGAAGAQHGTVALGAGQAR
ncbi:MAG: DUF3623 family protein [Rubrivivax sp.]|nr:DUF3623 family protein [Rubrivivax sp.]